eukprot:scaffold31553_cov63-Phaeocystis_antarctica.AAC.1
MPHDYTSSDCRLSIKGRRRLLGVGVQKGNHLLHLCIVGPGRKRLVTQQRHCEDLCNLEAKLRVGHLGCRSGVVAGLVISTASACRSSSTVEPRASARSRAPVGYWGGRPPPRDALVDMRAEREARHAVVLQGLREEIRARACRCSTR